MWFEWSGDKDLPNSLTLQVAPSTAHEGNESLLSGQCLQHWEKGQDNGSMRQESWNILWLCRRGVHATCWQFQSACGHQRALVSWCRSKLFGKCGRASPRVTVKRPEVTLALSIVMHHFSWANPDKAKMKIHIRQRKLFSVAGCIVHLPGCHLLERLSFDEWVLEIK